MLFMLAFFLLDVLVVQYGFAALVIECNVALYTAKAFFNMAGRIVRAKS